MLRIGQDTHAMGGFANYHAGREAGLFLIEGPDNTLETNPKTPAPIAGCVPGRAGKWEYHKALIKLDLPKPALLLPVPKRSPQSTTDSAGTANLPVSI
ncbi:MAG: hypothetical protein ACYS4W_10325 [Planctomycetota bacterium]